MFKKVSILIFFVLSISLLAKKWVLNPRFDAFMIYEDKIMFEQKENNWKLIPPRLYLDDTNPMFFSFLASVLKDAASNYRDVTIFYETYTSQTNGTYEKITQVLLNE